MIFSDINFLAVLVAAVAAFAWGAIWYMALSKPWLAAARIDPSQGSRSIQPFIVSFIMLLVMAIVIFVITNSVYLGEFTLSNGLMVGFVCWLGFILTTLAVNQRYQGYGWGLTIIDALHWLGVALIIGAILGLWGTGAEMAPVE
ncbi:MAG: DUF1761 domain-containing protein [Rhizobiaceae bacterium]